MSFYDHLTEAADLLRKASKELDEAAHGAAWDEIEPELNEAGQQNIEAIADALTTIVRRAETADALAQAAE